jgi:hypothetical protein
VRNPVERMYSAFKQTYSTYPKVGNFDDFVLPGIGVMEHKFSQLREMVSNGTAPDEVIRYYYEHSYEDVPQRAELFMPSLYALPIARYMSVFGAGNVKVVTAEDLDVRDQARLDETLNALFSFIGGCLLAMRRVICCCGLCLASTRLYVALL